MYKNLFSNAGLSLNEAEIYEYLLKSGESSAADIIKNTSLKKGMAYLEIENLAKKGLITKKLLKPKNPNVRNKSKIAYFTPHHPEKLREFIINKESEILTAKNNFEANFTDLVSDFNLISGKPGIQVFEGLEGMKKVLQDSLTSTEVIRTYADMEAIEKYLGKINEDYAKQRDKLNVRKRAILLDTPFARKKLGNYHSKTTEPRFMTKTEYPFKSVMQIYDNKISYINFSPKTSIGIIINDPEIYQMNCAIFEHAWLNARTYEQLEKEEKQKLS